jgi:hypothetical protein
MNGTAETSIKYVPLISPVHNPAQPFVDAGGNMARRQLLTEGERRQLFGVPADPDALVRHYTLSRSDLDLVATRRGDANRLGFAVQLALLRHQGLALAQAEGEIGTLVHWMARRIDIPVATFADYARRPQTMTDHARDLAAAFGLRPATDTDLPFMIEAAARAAWTTDKGLPIVAGIVAALRSERIILPAPAVIERAGAAGRARARQRVAEALLAGLTDEQLRALDELLVIDPKTGLTQGRRMKDCAPIFRTGSPDSLVTASLGVLLRTARILDHAPIAIWNRAIRGQECSCQRAADFSCVAPGGSPRWPG